MTNDYKLEVFLDEFCCSLNSFIDLVDECASTLSGVGLATSLTSNHRSNSSSPVLGEQTFAIASSIDVSAQQHSRLLGLADIGGEQEHSLGLVGGLTSNNCLASVVQDLVVATYVHASNVQQSLVLGLFELLEN